MSRSRKKCPAGGIAKAESDKFGKVMASRAVRRETQRILKATSDGDAVPDARQLGDPWTWPKDGKKWFGPRYPEVRRK